MKGHEEKYKVISEKYGITKEHARHICESQFEFTKEVISSGDDLPVRLQYLGKFMVTPGRRETVRKRRERMKEIKKRL